ncbi:MAG: type II toxin-antitoxin system RelE/ParE family toxin [Bacteroidota bacterium]
MKVSFRQSFVRDIGRITDARIRRRIQAKIEAVETARSLSEVGGQRRLRGEDGTYYRIRVGDYRIGMRMIDDEVDFVRVLHRREIYRYFP